MHARKSLRVAVIAIGLVACSWAILMPKSLHAATVLSGTVKSASGEKLSGATVSAKLEESNITTSVFTDERGDYYFPPMEAGKYQVWAQVTTYATGKGNVELNASAHQDFVLSPLKDYFKQLTGDVILTSLPDSTPNDKRLKHVFRNTCTGCHQPNFILQNRFDEQGWTSIMNLMRQISSSGAFLGPDTPPEPRILYHEQELAGYLARVRGPGPTEMEIKLRPRPSGEVARSVVTEYDVPLDQAVGYDTKYATNNGSDWSLGTPTRTNGAYGVHDGQADFFGNIWFAYSTSSPVISFGRVDAKTGEVRFFKVPGKNGMAAQGHGITRDQQGNLWLNVSAGPEPGSVAGFARVDPATLKIDVFRPDKSITGAGGTLDVDGLGGVWAATAVGAIRFDPKTQQWREFKSLTQQDADGNPNTYGLAATRDGNAFWAEMGIDIIGKSDMETGKTSEIKLPPVQEFLKLMTPEERQVELTSDGTANTGMLAQEGPRRMGSDQTTDTIWVCNSWGGNLVKIDVRTLKTSTIPLPSTDYEPYHAAVDSNHNVWLNMMDEDRVVRYNPKTNKWDSFPLPTIGAEPRYISVLDHNGPLQVIVPYARSRRVAKITFRSAQDMQALKNQSQQQQAQR